MREMPRIASKEEKTLKELRKQITVQPGVIEEVKQVDILAYNPPLIDIAVYYCKLLKALIQKFVSNHLHHLFK